MFSEPGVEAQTFGLGRFLVEQEGRERGGVGMIKLVPRVARAKTAGLPVSRDETDASVAACAHFRHRPHRVVHLVGGDRVDGERVGQVGEADEREAAPVEAFQPLVVEGAGREEDAADVARVQDGLQAFGRHRVADREFLETEAEFFCGRLGASPIEVELAKAAEFFRVRPLVEPREDRVDRGRRLALPVAHQRGERRVGPVAEFAGFLEHALAEIGRGAGLVSQGAGNRHGRDPERGGDVAQGHAPGGGGGRGAAEAWRGGWGGAAGGHGAGKKERRFEARGSGRGNANLRRLKAKARFRLGYS